MIIWNALSAITNPIKVWNETEINGRWVTRYAKMTRQRTNKQGKWRWPKENGDRNWRSWTLKNPK